MSTCDERCCVPRTTYAGPPPAIPPTAALALSTATGPPPAPTGPYHQQPQPQPLPAQDLTPALQAITTTLGQVCDRLTSLEQSWILPPSAMPSTTEANIG